MDRGSPNSVRAITEWLAGLTRVDREVALAQLSRDSRPGVQRALARFLAHWEAEERETERLKSLYRLEEEAHRAGYQLVAGVDEAGRGPLAGPVVAAAIILPESLLIPGLNDSKKIPEEKRERLYDQILHQALAFGVGRADPEFIDQHNILRATFWAMVQAIRNLPLVPDLVLVDGGFPIRNLALPQRAVIRGDSLSCSIAAASIIAKVTRDRLMREYDLVYPEYGFSQNKGYGTPEHLAALTRFGPCPIHRRSFSWEVAATREE
ncbi:MAG: ribonuclease HII [Firmicutes bacterium]|nr:ribonuclease HII [Bacillota bacterium]MCL5040363.1 ribonuclease HII [Bacillota bacterium]